MSKIKELNLIVFKKGLLVSIKEHLCWTKGPLDNPEGQVEVESPLIVSYFLIYIKKNILFKKGTFNKVSDAWMLYCSEIGLVSFFDDAGKESIVAHYNSILLTEANDKAVFLELIAGFLVMILCETISYQIYQIVLFIWEASLLVLNQNCKIRHLIY